MIDPRLVLLLSAVLFSLGVVGVLLRRGAITILMCVELMLNAGNLAFIAFARLAGEVPVELHAGATATRGRGVGQTGAGSQARA